jgi:hypothetical protein
VIPQDSFQHIKESKVRRTCVWRIG